MASKKISELIACTAPSTNDKLVLVANAGSNTQYCTVNNFFNNAAVNVTANVVTGNTVIISSNLTPANSTANGVKGTIVWDSTYIYIAVANNSWKRIALTTF